MALNVEHPKFAELDALLANMAPRARLNLLLRVGMPADVVMGVETCAEHAGWRQLSPTEPLSFEGDCVWCRACFRWLHK